MFKMMALLIIGLVFFPSKGQSGEGGLYHKCPENDVQVLLITTEDIEIKENANLKAAFTFLDNFATYTEMKVKIISYKKADYNAYINYLNCRSLRVIYNSSHGNPLGIQVYSSDGVLRRWVTSSTIRDHVVGSLPGFVFINHACNCLNGKFANSVIDKRALGYFGADKEVSSSSADYEQSLCIAQKVIGGEILENALKICKTDAKKVHPNNPFKFGLRGEGKYRSIRSNSDLAASLFYDL